MSRFSKRVNRDWFPAKTILDELSIKGRIGSDEGKRLLEEACHAIVRLQEKLKASNAHAGAIIKITEGIL